MKVVEDLYDARTCRLFVALLDGKNAPTWLQKDVKIKALEEVENVISSIERKEKTRNPVPLISAGSQATLNQVLKAYGEEGWVGGKIGYVPESQTQSVVVVKYDDGKAIEEKPPETPKDTITSGLTPPSTPPEVVTKKKIVKEEDDDEEERANVLKSALGEDGLYFEDSYLL